MNKVALILYRNNWMRNMDTDKKATKSFDYFLSLASAKIDVCLSTINLYNEKQGEFTALFLLNGNWLWKKGIKPGVVYDKSEYDLESKTLEALRKKISRNFTFVNSLDLKELMSNKWKSYLLFKKYSPRTLLINTKADLPLIGKLSTEKVVVKPISGSCGKNVGVYLKKKVIPLAFPFIIQEFIESKRGISGVLTGTHDLRIFFFNKTPFYSYARMPQTGSLISNIATGGSLKVVSLNKISRNVMKIAREATEKLSRFGPRIFAIDFMLDAAQRPWLIELNSCPSFVLEREEHRYKQEFFKPILDFLLNPAKK